MVFELYILKNLKNQEVFIKGGRKNFEGGKGKGQYQTEQVMVDQKIRRKYDLRMVFELEMLKNLKD